jgi:hypothetical protein
MDCLSNMNSYSQPSIIISFQDTERERSKDGSTDTVNYVGDGYAPNPSNGPSLDSPQVKDPYYTDRAAWVSPVF